MVRQPPPPPPPVHAPHDLIANYDIQVFPAFDLPEVRFRQCDLDITGVTQDEREHESDAEQHEGDFDEGDGAEGDESGVIGVLNELDADSDADTEADVDANADALQLVDALLVRVTDVCKITLARSSILTSISGAHRGRRLLRGDHFLHALLRPSASTVCLDTLRQGWFRISSSVASGTHITPRPTHAQ